MIDHRCQYTRAAALPGEQQSVPRSELYAIVQVVELERYRGVQLRIFTDHDNHANTS